MLGRIVATLMAAALICVVGCKNQSVVSLVESHETAFFGQSFRVTEYEATLENLGKTAEGDSLAWSLRRVTPDGGSWSPVDKAIQDAKRKMSVRFLKPTNSFVKFGNAISQLRASLTNEAIEQVDIETSKMDRAKKMISEFLWADPSIGSLMATAPVDLLVLSSLKAGHNDSLVMRHPFESRIPLLYSIHLVPVKDGLEGSAVIDRSYLEAMSESLRVDIGKVGRFVRRNTDPEHLELTVVDTLFHKEKLVLRRIYRTELPLP